MHIIDLGNVDTQIDDSKSSNTLGYTRFLTLDRFVGGRIDLTTCFNHGEPEATQHCRSRTLGKHVAPIIPTEEMCS